LLQVRLTCASLSIPPQTPRWLRGKKKDEDQNGTDYSYDEYGDDVPANMMMVERQKVNLN
jgi:hypothetical protein